MRYYDKITPDGTRDLLFDECVARDRVTDRLSETFRRRGYRKVMTPAIEFYDVFDSSAAYFPQESMYKLTDQRGRLMVLRPDCTIPIARLTATRLSEMPMPLRLYYNQSVYRMEHNLRGRPSEIFQSGVELIGCAGLASDLEMVELAAEGLSGIQAEGFRIELCHIGYFKALIDRLETDEGVKEDIRQRVEQKNYAALSDLLEPFAGSKAAAALKYLPRLFGGKEVFQTAYELFDDAGARQSLDYLRAIYESLCRLGLGERVIIDLGLVNQAEYYTGLIFRGYFDGVGEPVLSGGRYDNLISDFGVPLSATGFAVNMDLAAQVLPKEGGKAPDVLVFAGEDRLPEAIRYVKSLIQEGLTVESAACETLEQAMAYARARNIGQVHQVAEEVTVLPVEGGGA